MSSSSSSSQRPNTSPSAGAEPPVQPVQPDWAAWCRANPQLVSLTAGAFAGTTAETLLFPLDCLKTRLQSKRGFVASGGFRGVYNGVGTAIAGGGPASAIFFYTYETTKRNLSQYDQSNSIVGFCSIGLLASIMGELTAGVVRVPVDLVKQRQQAGHGQSFADVVRGVRKTHGSVFVASFKASFMRDILHSSLQFPLYDCLKLALAGMTCNGRVELLPTWQAASCGSVAGVISAILSTPLDVLRTRLNLRGEGEVANAVAQKITASELIRCEAKQVYRERGLQGFFSGATCRAAWMGLGGFIFLGSFELAKKKMLADAHGSGDEPLPKGPSLCIRKTEDASLDIVRSEAQAELKHNRQLGLEPPPFVSLAAGLLAGIAVDFPLHPLDTVKTRMQSLEGFVGAGGFRHVWSGLSAVLLVSVPGSALFFFIYECTRHFVERRVPATFQKDQFSMARDAIAASVADVSACVVRVPCEVLKQRMQALGPNTDARVTFRSTVRSVSSGEGLRGFFAGFGATALREVPFALIQMPLFEELKHLHPWSARAKEAGDTKQLGFIGMQAGFVAGGIAGCVTTPLDAAKTRIILTRNPADRLSIWRTMSAIRSESGFRGLFRGIVPRTLHCGIGGALWLGAFESSKLLLWQHCT